MHAKNVDDLRSNRWFKRDDLRSFGHRSRVKQMGYWDEEFVGKPVIAIINTWNDLNTCHSHFPERVKDIKRGITAAGGFAVELPAMSAMNLQGALQKVQGQIAAPYDRELQNLQNDLKSAGKFLGDIVGYKLASSE